MTPAHVVNIVLSMLKQGEIVEKNNTQLKPGDMFTKGLAVTSRDRGGNNETSGSQLHHLFFFYFSQA